jgi:hypothetical protein
MPHLLCSWIIPAKLPSRPGTLHRMRLKLFPPAFLAA